jgi:hypothetical protein
MAYPERLMRRRKVFDERTPSGETVDELVRRYAPAIKSILAEEPPVRLQPIVRTGDIPVTDSLPAPQVGFRTPEVGYQNATNSVMPPSETRLRRVSPEQLDVAGQYPSISNATPIPNAPDVSNVSPNVITEALRRIHTPQLETNSQPTDSTPRLQPIAPYETINGVVPITANDTSARDRLVRPVDPLLKAGENDAYARSAPLDYGQDKEGNQRVKPAGGFGGRLKAGLKLAGISALRDLATNGLGGGLGGAITGLAMGAARPEMNAQIRRQGEIGANDANLQRQFGIAKTQTGLANDQSVIARRNAEIPYLEARPQLEADKLQAKRDYDSWRMKSGERKADTYDNFIKWRMENGDQRLASYQDYLDFQKQSGERRQTEVERHNRTNEDIGRSNVGVRSESNQIRRETGSSNGDVTRDRAKAQSLINQARAYRARAASAKTDEAAAELNATAQQFEEDAATQYPDYVDVQETPAVRAGGVSVMGGSRQVRLNPRTSQGRATSGSAVSLPKLDEAKIRAAALSHNPPLDPDEAVKRARIRKQL